MDLEEMGQRVAAWAAPLGYSSDALRNGCVIYNTGGETRFSVRRTETEIVVTSATRSESEVFEMASSRADDCEKFLLSLQGYSLRSRLMGSSFGLREPYAENEVAAPFRLAATADGPRYATLFEDDRYRASFASTRGAVLFSHYANVTAEELKSSYLDTTGTGLFPFDTGRSAAGHRLPSTT